MYCLSTHLGYKFGWLLPLSPPSMRMSYKEASMWDSSIFGVNRRCLRWQVSAPRSASAPSSAPRSCHRASSFYWRLSGVCPLYSLSLSPSLLRSSRLRSAANWNRCWARVMFRRASEWYKGRMSRKWLTSRFTFLALIWVQALSVTVAMLGDRKSVNVSDCHSIWWFPV